MSQLHMAGRQPAWSLLRPILLTTALLDELVSGFLVVGLPLVRNEFQLSYAQAGLLFAAGQASSLVLEPLINLSSDRRSKHGPVVLGMLALAAGFALAAAAPGFGWLLLALTLIFPAGGAAVGLAQATLVDQSIAGAPRTMTRWTIMAALGDLLSPLAVAAIVALGFGWRPLFWTAAALWLVAGLLTLPQRFPRAAATAAAAQAPAPGMLENLRTALRSRTLLRWTAVLLLTDMLDEVFLGFIALYLHDIVALSPATASLVLGAQMLGALLGLLIVERLLARYPGPRLLPWLAALTLAGVLALLFGRSAWLAALALFSIGLGASGWYPIAKAAAYATLPGRSGTVRAVKQIVGAPFDIALPLLIGLLAGRFGLLAGLGLLGAAPLLVLILAPRGGAAQGQAGSRRREVDA